MACISFGIWYCANKINGHCKNFPEYAFSSEAINATKETTGSSSESYVVHRTIPKQSTIQIESKSSNIRHITQRIDYAIIQATKRLGLPVQSIRMLQSVWCGNRAYSQDAYRLQRISISSPISMNDFSSSLMTFLSIYEKKATVQALSRAEHPLIQIKIDKKTTHEIFFSNFVYEPSIENTPRMAIIVQGLGDDINAIKRLTDLDISLSFSINPNAIKAHETAAIAHSKQYSIMAELSADTNRQQTISSDAIKMLVKYCSTRLPEASAICLRTKNENSGFLESPDLCKTLANEAVFYGLSIFDSIPYPSSKAVVSAQNSGITAWKNDYFINGKASTSVIVDKLYSAEQYARKNGHCIVAIESTLNSIQGLEIWSVARNKKVTIVPIFKIPQRF